MTDRLSQLVLGIDPGSDYVGWSLGRGHETPIFAIFSPDEFLMAFEETTVRRVAIERFDTRQLTNESQRTVEVIGAIKWICRRDRISINFVNASDKQKFEPMLSKKHPDLKSHALDAECIRMWDLAYGRW